MYMYDFTYQKIATWQKYIRASEFLSNYQSLELHSYREPQWLGKLLIRGNNIWLIIQNVSKFILLNIHVLSMVFFLFPK